VDVDLVLDKQRNFMKMNKKICVLTYDTPHRKTHDLLLGLKGAAYNDVDVFAVEWKKRKNFVPLYPHRPPALWDTYPEKFCRNLGFNFAKIKNYDDISDHSEQTLFLVAGAGILPENFVENNMVINSHPGYLPYSRGLDSLKWSIYYGKPIGVTTHIASKECDAGLLIDKKLVPLFSWDTFHSVAYRQYEMEIKMLVEAVEKVDETPLVEISGNESKVFRRMPHRLELRLMGRFENMIGNVETINEDVPY